MSADARTLRWKHYRKRGRSRQYAAETAPRPEEDAPDAEGPATALPALMGRDLILDMSMSRREDLCSPPRCRGG